MLSPSKILSMVGFILVFWVFFVAFFFFENNHMQNLVRLDSLWLLSGHLSKVNGTKI